MRLPVQRIAVVGAAAAVVLGLAAFRASDSYEVSVVLDSATNVVEGGPVQVDGFAAGRVDSISVKDGKALVRFSLEDDFAPLHEGAQVQLSWKAVMSERQFVIADGSDKNAPIPDGGMVPGQMPKPTEIDDVLRALDPPTRARLTSLVGRLQQTVEGNEQPARESLDSAGPALRELGQLLQAVGTDGPAIKDLIRRMNEMMGAVAAREDSVARIVSDLDALTGQVATQRAQLRGTLERLPGTLDQATSTLRRVPGSVDAAVPLLQDLEPATRRLAPTARNLRPVLADLRPAAADLRPTLARLNDLLGLTPGLTDRLNGFLPDLDTTVQGLDRPLEFMRPYTPEVTGMISTWNSAFANYDAEGNYTRLHIQGGPSSLNVNPGVVPAGIVNDPYPAPGASVNQPWTDAFGSGMR